jgi:hypothetical protein
VAQAAESEDDFEVTFDAVPVAEVEPDEPLSEGDGEDAPAPLSLLPADTEAEEPLRESVR